MKFKNKLNASIKAGFKATFHKKTIYGSMGYFYDEIENIGNIVDYMKYNKDCINLCISNSESFKIGRAEFNKKNYKRAYEIFISMPDNLYAEKNYALAICLLYGKGVKRDVKKGFELLNEGAKCSACCKQMLARCYIEGFGTNKNLEKAYDMLSDVIKCNEKKDINYDYLMPDIYYFCGEYELENENYEKAIEHLKYAAIYKQYGRAYYMLGRYYYKNNYELSKIYMDKAKTLGVNVSTYYYKNEREEVVEKEIDLGASDKIAKISKNMVNIEENMEKLAPNKIVKNFNDAKVERINSEINLKKAKSLSELYEKDNLYKKENDIKKSKIETEYLNSESKEIKARIRNSRWKKKNK